MQFQFNSDNQITGDADMEARVREITEARLARITDRLTRVEVHVGDVNGPKGGGDDKRCAIEARPAGMAPISASGHAATIEAAVAGAADKVLAAYDRLIGKRTDRKGH